MVIVPVSQTLQNNHCSSANNCHTVFNMGLSITGITLSQVSLKKYMQNTVNEMNPCNHAGKSYTFIPRCRIIAAIVLLPWNARCSYRKRGHADVSRESSWVRWKIASPFQATVARRTRQCCEISTGHVHWFVLWLSMEKGVKRLGILWFFWMKISGHLKVGKWFWIFCTFLGFIAVCSNFSTCA